MSIEEEEGKKEEDTGAVQGTLGPSASCVCTLYFVLHLAFIQYNIRTWPSFAIGLHSPWPKFTWPSFALAFILLGLSSLGLHSLGLHSPWT